MTTTLTYDLAGRTTSVVHATPEPAEPAPAAEEPAVPLVTEVDACRGIDDYLGTRTIAAAGEQNECVKTWDYLARRTLPTVEPPAPAGASLRYDYTHDAAGNVTTSTRTLAEPEVPGPEAEASGEPTDGEAAETDAASPADAAAAVPAVLDVWEREFGYDDLARLTVSTSASTGEVNEYGYDPAGNRTSWTQTGAPTGDSAVEAMFNAAGQLTGTTTTGAGAGTASYSYDAAGNRSSVSQGGVTTQFVHDPAGRLTGTSTDGRSTTYAYDGLDRQVSTTDATAFGTDTTQQSWDGLTPAFTDSGLHGDTSLFRDPYGDVAVQDGPYGAEWLLGDQRNTTATTDSAGQITDLVDYGDFGDARYQSTGWGSYVGNDGQPGDATLGVDQYYARNYDPSVGSWLEPDDWRGLLTQPQTLNRHAYVTNNPATYSDLLGYLQMRFDGGRAGKFIPMSVSVALDKRDRTRIKNYVNSNRNAVGKPPIETLGTLDGKRGGPSGKQHNPNDRSSGYTSNPHPGTCSYATGTLSCYAPAAPAPLDLSTINCATDVKVGMDSRQMEINAACGRALADANARTQSKEYQDFYFGYQTFNDALAPAAPLVGVVLGGAAAGRSGTGAGTGSRSGGVIATNPGRASGGPTGSLNWGQQEKHFPGHVNFQSGRSMITANPELMALRAGSGQPVGSVPRGQPGFRERVDFGYVIGSYVKDGVGTPTTVGIFHYKKDGSFHIVPAAPKP